MNCQACGKPVSTYDSDRGQVSCKNGHIWTLPEYADLPVADPDLRPPMLRPVRRRSFPLWPLAALPGVAALILELLR